MTSSLTQYSSLIDVTFPIPGVDNDTQGFRDNYIQITQAFNTAAFEISNLQLGQANLITQLNNATVVGTNFATNLSNTVTNNIINSLTNYSPDIVTPTVNMWWINTSKPYIDAGTSTIQLEINGLITQVNSNTTDLTSLQIQTGAYVSTASYFTGVLPTSSKGQAGDRPGFFYANGNYVYICYSAYSNGAADIWARVATTSTTWTT